MTKSPGQQAYERDLAASPNYTGTDKPRKPWDALDDEARAGWERNPRSRLGAAAADDQARFVQDLAAAHGLTADDVSEVLFRIGRQPTVRAVHILGAAGAVLAERYAARPDKLLAIPAIAAAIAARLGVSLS